MALVGRLSVLAVFVFLAMASVSGAAPLTCRDLRTRMDQLRLTIRQASGKEAAARAKAELDRLAAQANRVCTTQGAEKVKEAAPQGVMPPQVPGEAAETPEEECKRRRDMINRQGKPIPGLFRGVGQTNSAMRAMPLTGSITIEGATASTLYGKVRQELNYAVRETFVGNLIVSGADGREEYAIQTISTEIDVEHFNGRSCAKYTGSPPACSQWYPIDLWQIADGEEYPGKADSVVTATSDSRGMTIRIAAPVIEFGSSMGPASIKPGCGGMLRETVKRDEVRQWLRRSTVRIKREMGQTAPGCRPGASLILEMRLGADS
ncbi:MAG: hypothetical protein FWD79_10305 [Desulfobulbus sp.]|nr:hypothetical protein [Desulfobulbus sp.]